MANFLRAEIWSNLQCAGGTKLDVFDPLQRCDESQQLDGNDSVSIEYAASDSAASHITTRRVIRLCFSDGSFSEWRIQEPESRFGSSGNTQTVKAVSVLFDLADATIITETQASGVVDFDVGLFQVTVTEVIDNYLIAKLPASYNYFARGTIEPTALYDVAFAKATPLALLQQLAEHARDPVTRRPAEIRVRRNGTTGYYIDVLTEIGSSQAVADLRSTKNVIDHVYNRNAQEQATVVFPFGLTDAAGAPTTIARVAFQLDNGSSNVFEITDPEGGPSPVLEDDQLNGMYVVPVGLGSAIQITDSAAGTPATVTLASSTGITDGDIVELRADAIDTLLTELSSPSAVASYGRKVGTVDRDTLAYHQLALNPWFATWSNPSVAPEFWDYGGTTGFSQNTDPLYTQHGASSVYGSFNVGNTTGVLLSDPIYVRPITGASQFSLKISMYLRVFTGQALITAYIYNAVIPQSPQVLGQVQIVPTNYPLTTTSPRVAAASWFTMTVNAADLTPLLTSGARIYLQFGAFAGRIEAFVDAVSLVQLPEVPDDWVQYSSANALWHAGNLGLQFNKDPIASYDIGVVDRTRMDGTAYPFEELVIGGTIRDTVPEQGINGVLVRITGKRVNHLKKGDTKLEVATRRKLLADLLLGSSSSGATIAISGGGSSGGTQPPAAPPPGTNPPPGSPPVVGGPGSGSGGGSGGSAPSLPLLKTIWALGPGETTVIEDFPSADTEIDANDQFFVDLTQIKEVALSGKVVTAGAAGSGLRLKYLRPSDSSWRYLDGAAGPELMIDAAGRIVSITSVTLESDAQGQRWLSPYGINGDDATSPELSHLALHGGPVIVVGTPAVPVTDYWDWNPTEGAGSVITDKNGSGVDLATSGVWVASGQIRYDCLGLFNFRYARVVNPLVTMAAGSSVFVYVKLPASWTVGTYLLGHQTIESGHINDRKLQVGIGGPVTATITQLSDVSDKTVTSTSTFAVTDEFVAGWTHDGTTLRLYINGVEEDSIACGPAGTQAPLAFQIGGGEPPFSDKQPPSTNGLFGSTGAIFGRCLAANRAFDAGEIATFYAEYQTQYPGLP